jgi:hypothetical protein
LEEDMVEFGRRGFGEDGKGGWLLLRQSGCEEGVVCIPVFLWAEDEAVKERVWVLR